MYMLNNGIRQGDPLSMALYQFYNTDILDIPGDKSEAAIVYVDDAILTATADTFQQAHQQLSDMMTRDVTIPHADCSYVFLCYLMFHHFFPALPAVPAHDPSGRHVI